MANDITVKFVDFWNGWDDTDNFLLDALRQSPPVVHLASHFVFKPGDEQKSFLLTGDGELTLAEIRDREKGYRFEDVDLVALSACESAEGRVQGGDDVVDADYTMK